MGFLEIFLSLFKDDTKKRVKKTEKDFDCCYDCRDCPYSEECGDDGSYLEDGDDENY